MSTEYTEESQGAMESRLKEGGKVVLGLSGFVFIGLLTYYGFELPFVRQVLGVYFLGLSMFVYYLNEVIKHEWEWTNRRLLLELGFLIASTLTSLYIVANYEVLRFERVGYINSVDFVVGIVIIAAIAYATFKEFGRSFGFVLLGSISYMFVGPVLPGFLQHEGFSVDTVVSITTVSLAGGAGAYGFITEVIAAWVAIFVIFAGFIQGYGGLDWIKRGGEIVGKYTRSGPVQTAVISSMGFGAISGSGAANTAITGSFTIPLMKDSQKLPGKYAAAIEGVASAGGQLMPPVMGASAFVMAEFLGVRLAQIIIWATPPAIIFYVSLMIGGHLLSLKHGDVDDSRLDVDFGAPYILTEGYPIYVPILVLIYLLVALNMNIILAGLYATASILPLILVYAFLGPGISGAETVVTEGKSRTEALIKSTLEGARLGIVTAGKIGIVGAAVGIILAVISTTAVASRVALSLLEISGGTLLILLILVALLAIVLGMGAPPIAAYIVTVTILAPSLVEFGIPEPQTHFFVFYFAVVSFITPPIAVATVISSSIADSDFLISSLEAVRFGIPLYLLPFAFIYFDLIPEGSVLSLGYLLRFLLVLVSIVAIMYGSYADRGSIMRGSSVVGGVLLFVLPPLLLF